MATTSRGPMRTLYAHTPLLHSLELSNWIRGEVYLKMEALQPSGSFKNRGIGYICSYYAETGEAKCFISSSGGNAGLAVAYSGRHLKIPVTVVVPTSSASFMVEKIRAEGAEVVVHGSDWQEADQLAKELSQTAGSIYISPFDHPLIWQGHSTLIEEVAKEGITPDAVVVAVGGGGLFCGIAQGMHRIGWQDAPIFTAETEGADSFAQSIAANQLITLDRIQTIATSLGARRVAEEAFKRSKEHPVIPKVVSDKQALQACCRFLDHHRLLVEPACGAALALIYERLIDTARYPKILVVVCGGSAVTQARLQDWKQLLGVVP